MSRVYISSTYNDLAEFRDAVYRVLRKMRYDVIAMEDYLAADERPLDKCLADVTSCDSYVGIFAWRYGYIPPGRERSITELEYRHAGQHEISRFIFLLDRDAPWPPGNIDRGVSLERLESLREELQKNHTVQYFKDPNDLAASVAATFAGESKKRLDANMENYRARKIGRDEQYEGRLEQKPQRVVNVCPLDVENFKGRRRELNELNDYLSEEGVHLVSIIGRGGMGKTALACYVLGELEKVVKANSNGEPPLTARHIDGLLYLSGVSTGLSLERIFVDTARMLGEPAASSLMGHFNNGNLPLAVKIQHLMEALKDGQYIILMDNMELMLDAGGAIKDEELRVFVEHCLTQCKGVRLVITSRERLNIPPSALHYSRTISLEEGLDGENAVAVLRDLDPQGDIGLRDAPEDQLLQVVQLTHGIPRALEILAGLLVEDPTLSLNRLLDDRDMFGAEVMNRLVSTGYNHLDKDAQQVLKALSVYNVPVDETAVEFLLHPWYPGLDVRSCLRRLVNNYFVKVNRGTGEYSLHPLDREYAYEKIPAELAGGAVDE
jgi:hypothetical protein